MKFVIDENTEFSNKILLYLSIYRVLNKIATILLCLIIFCNFNNIFCLLFLVGLIIKNILLFFKIKIIINYDDKVLKKFESDCAYFKGISKIEINNQNYLFSVKKHKPYYINFNLSIYEIKLNGCCMYCLPKGLLFFSKETVDYISFKNLKINYDKNLKCIIINKIIDLENIVLYLSNETFDIFLKYFDNAKETFDSTNEKMEKSDIIIKSIEDLKLNNNNILTDDVVANETINSNEYKYPTLDFLA